MYIPEYCSLDNLLKTIMPEDLQHKPKFHKGLTKAGVL